MESYNFSFEFFPPKTEKAAENLQTEVKALNALNPNFMTVTYGAGGSTRDKTLDIALKIAKDTGLPTAAHITYINTPRNELKDITQMIWDSGIHHLVALRGDMPQDLQWPLDQDADYFQYTSHFVAALKYQNNFEVSVGAYPEKHPDAADLSKDIEALRRKCDAGADRAITQFFFNNDVYLEFLEQTHKAGITTPIVPGILPILNYEKMLSFAETCQTDIPVWLRDKFESSQEDDHPKIAQEILVEQLQNLAANNIDSFHIYTLNKSQLITEAIKSLR